MNDLVDVSSFGNGDVEDGAVDTDQYPFTSLMSKELNPLRDGWPGIEKKSENVAVVKNLKLHYNSYPYLKWFWQSTGVKDGSGKTSILRYLAFQIPTWEGHDSQDTEMLFNGEEAHPEYHRTQSALVPAFDYHLPFLTVEETLIFAMYCTRNTKFYKFEQHPSWRSWCLEPLTHRQGVRRAQILTRALRIRDSSRNTIIGNDIVRGISGGEKRRVSTGVQMFINPVLFALDQATTGLDAASSYEIFADLREYSRRHSPVVATLQQPGPKVFDLFDDLLVLAPSGQQIYYGPREGIIPFMAQAGFTCPEGVAPADFVQDVISGFDPANLKQTEPNLSLPLKLVDQWNCSDTKRELLQEIEGDLAQAVPAAKPKTSRVKEAYKVFLLFDRALDIYRHNPKAAVEKIFALLLVGLICGTAYLPGIGDSQADARRYAGLMYYIQCILSLFGGLVVPKLFSERHVFFWQRDLGYFKPIWYQLANFVITLPLTAIGVFFFCLPIFLMAGFEFGWGAEKFTFFIVHCLMYLLVVEQVYKFFSYLISSAVFVTRLVPTIMLITTLFSSFYIVESRMPDYLVWLYYLSPARWSFEGLMINALLDADFDCDNDELVPTNNDPRLNLPFQLGGYEGSQVCPWTDGEDVLDRYELSTEFYWKWVCFLVLLGEFLLLYVLSMLVLYLQRERPPYSATLQPELIDEPFKDLDEGTNKGDDGSGAVLTFTDIKYSISGYQVLHGISAFVKPGMMVALMGPSGAGKTTLLDILTDRKTTGNITGDIYINGKPRDPFFVKYTGYVEQFPPEVEEITVYESLLFSCGLRVPSSHMNAREKAEHIAEIIDTMNLKPIQNIQVRYLSAEQRKRVAIAGELATDPALLFLDEPTSGIDAVAASSLVAHLQAMADKGKAVICTIHQPSDRVFKTFSHLLLLQAGGKMAYFGEVSKLGAFLESTAGAVCPADENIADFALEAVGTKAEVEPNKLWKECGRDEEVMDEIQSINERLASVPDEDVRMQRACYSRLWPYSVPPWTQFWYLFRRCFARNFRDYASVFQKLLVTTFSSLLAGLVFLQLDNDVRGASERISIIFFLCLIVLVTPLSNTSKFVYERPVLYRDRAFLAYNTIIYNLAHYIAEMPLTILSLLLAFTPAYFMAGLRTDDGGGHYFLLMVYVLILWHVFFGFVLLITAIAPTFELATALASVYLASTALFSGTLIIESDIPYWWRWFYYIGGLFITEPMYVNELKGFEVECSSDDLLYIPVPTAVNVTQPATQPYCPLLTGDQLLEALDFDEDFVWWNLLITICYFFLLTLAGVLLYTRCKHIKR